MCPYIKVCFTEPIVYIQLQKYFSAQSVSSMCFNAERKQPYINNHWCCLLLYVSLINAFEGKGLLDEETYTSSNPFKTAILNEKVFPSDTLIRFYSSYSCMFYNHAPFSGRLYALVYFLCRSLSFLCSLTFSSGSGQPGDETASHTLFSSHSHRLTQTQMSHIAPFFFCLSRCTPVGLHYCP